MEERAYGAQKGKWGTKDQRGRRDESGTKIAQEEENLKRENEAQKAR